MSAWQQSVSSVSQLSCNMAVQLRYVSSAQLPSEGSVATRQVGCQLSCDLSAQIKFVISPATGWLSRSLSPFLCSVFLVAVCQLSCNMSCSHRSAESQEHNPALLFINVQKTVNEFPYKGAEYSPHTPVPHKSMSSKSAQNSQRHSHNPLKHFSHPSTHHSHKRFTSYHPPRLSIDSLIRVCALSQSPFTPLPPSTPLCGGRRE